MRFDEFTALVGQMRAAQKAYYKSRLQADLFKCKDLERRVDKALVEGVTFTTLATGGAKELIQTQLDLLGEKRPTDQQGDMNNNEKQN
jgi:hypothetical protein